MAARSDFWSTNQRIQRAAENKPSMKVFEPDHEAVKLLQQALVDTGIDTNLKVDGIYGQKTAGAVREVQRRFNMDKDGGAAGRQVIGILDILLQGGTLGADLARQDVQLASVKVLAAITALTTFRLDLITNNSPSQLTVDALLTHFRLATGPSTTGVARQVTLTDVDTILARYQQLMGLFGAAATRFETGVPVNGILTAAEAPLNGPVRFGPAYTDVDSNFGDRIGPNSRAAVVIHEGTHVFDAESGRDETHISEFDPAYDVQSADNSLHNPSSFAGFAAHIRNGSDPNPRFGLGATSRGL